MRRLNFFVGSNRPWQLIKTLKTKLWLRRLTQLTVSMVHGRCIYFSFAKCTRKLLLGNLFAVDKIFYGQLRPENIQYFISIHENWKLSQSFSNSLKALKVRRCFNQQKYCPGICYRENFTGSKIDVKYVNIMKWTT